MRDVTDNNTSWRKVKPIFSEKMNSRIEIMLVE